MILLICKFNWVGVHDVFCDSLNKDVLFSSSALSWVYVWLNMSHNLWFVLTECQSQTGCSGLAACLAWWCTTGYTAPWGSLHGHTGGRRTGTRIKKNIEKGRGNDTSAGEQAKEQLKEPTEGSGKWSLWSCFFSLSLLLMCRSVVVRLLVCFLQIIKLITKKVQVVKADQGG